MCASKFSDLSPVAADQEPHDLYEIKPVVLGYISLLAMKIHRDGD
jgi:hypothetical protein